MSKMTCFKELFLYKFNKNRHFVFTVQYLFVCVFLSYDIKTLFFSVFQALITFFYFSEYTDKKRSIFTIKSKFIFTVKSKFITKKFFQEGIYETTEFFRREMRETH